ncbi:SPL family radical SAM protein [Cohnella zeiphila]|uniref:Radical SAM protein n=1 Tax=Cohnella zeiphila TaxID=2761120 RepID=A0A7X0VUA1_9BACL|nr:radical SAM protein [Cohnella zeiphila]MBB6730042.1 radical SAM protein [Cohnella zeiphila]
MPLPQYEPMSAKSILNPVKAPSMPFDWSINPYRGCQHGCSFCYARSTHAYLGEETDDTFQRHIFWKEDAPSILRAQLAKMGKRVPREVAIGTATDPYQQLEGRSKLTRGCLEVLAEFGVAASVTTRSPLILRDLDLLTKMPGSSVNVSIHSLDPFVWRTFEPSSPSPKLRLDCGRRLREAGVRVRIFMAPILPYLTDTPEKTEELIAACAKAGLREVMPSFLRLSTPDVKLWFFNVLRTFDPKLAERYGRLYWRSKRLPDDYTRPIKERIQAQMIRYGLRQAESYAASSSASSEPASRRRAADGESAQSQQFRRPADPPADPCAPVQLTLF